VQRTGDIGLFKIVAEGGVAAGMRRVEAVTGANALAYTRSWKAPSTAVAGTLKATPAEVPAAWPVLDQCVRWKRKSPRSRASWPPAQGDELLAQAVDVKGIKVLAAVLEGADAKTLRETMDKLKDKLKTAAIVLAAVDGGKVQLAAGVTADSIGKVKAGELVNFVAQQVGGKGGGKPDMAMAGGTESGAEAFQRGALRFQRTGPARALQSAAWESSQPQSGPPTRLHLPRRSRQSERQETAPVSARM
jgi:alanyl-tRNA synthetase